MMTDLPQFGENLKNLELDLLQFLQALGHQPQHLRICFYVVRELDFLNPIFSFDLVYDTAEGFVAHMNRAYTRAFITKLLRDEILFVDLLEQFKKGIGELTLRDKKGDQLDG